MLRTAILSLMLSAALPLTASAQDAGHDHAGHDHAAHTPGDISAVATETAEDRVLGNADAPHTLIVYASNTCPHCGSWFNNEWPTVKSELVDTGKLRFVFRPFPTQPVDLSLTAFMMAECAADENYMTVIEDQFARQEAILRAPDGETLRAQFAAIAAASGLENDEEIGACLNNEDNFATLQTLAQQAQAAQIRSVPTFIYDGELQTSGTNAEMLKGWVEASSE